MRVLNLSLMLAAIFIAGCSGNGVQYARIADEILKSTGSLFIGRESQWFGRAISVEVQLNGRPIAVLAEGQSVSSKTLPGENVVRIIPAGPASLIYQTQEVRITGYANDNNFVLIRVDEALPGFGGEIRVTETDSKIFASAVGT